MRDAPQSISPTAAPSSSDRRAFKKTVLNLIAVNCTPAGGTATCASHRRDALLETIDTGVGLSAGNFEKLGAPENKTTGLGVALTTHR